MRKSPEQICADFLCDTPATNITQVECEKCGGGLKIRYMYLKEAWYCEKTNSVLAAYEYPNTGNMEYLKSMPKAFHQWGGYLYLSKMFQKPECMIPIPRGESASMLMITIEHM